MTAEHPIAAFLKARLDEDEQAAREALPALVSSHGTVMWPDYETFDSPALDTATAYLERFQPARVLREVEAKRRILAEMVPILEDLNEIAYSEGQAAKRPGRPGEYMDGDHEPELHLLRLLALPYADHPDYSSVVTPETP